MPTPFAKLYASLLRVLPIPKRLRDWWNRQAPHRQDRYAMLAPLVAVFFFFTAIVVAVGYLRIEEMEREQEALRRTWNTRSNACACACWNGRRIWRDWRSRSRTRN